MNKRMTRQQAHKLVDHIFCDLLVKQGMACRTQQIQLSHKMLDAMMNRNIALCDAGTGIGKTYAYLVAGIVYDRFRRENGLAMEPLVISTSSIALQNAVKREYLPLLSAVLLEDGLIENPVMAVIRKGKGHYVCDNRLRRRLRQLEKSKKNKCAMEALRSLKDNLDLDAVTHLSDYDRQQVRVPQICDCGINYCRYKDYLSRCESGDYLFQICNHNLLLADAIHRTAGKKPIFPEYCALVMDESHKLPEVAREMFGLSLCEEDFNSMIYGLKMEKYLLAADYLKTAAEPLLEMLGQAPTERDFGDYITAMKIPYCVLVTVQKNLCKNISPLLRRNLSNLISTLEAFLHADESENVVCYVTESDTGKTLLCLSIYDMADRMRETLWESPRAMVLTSGTLAIGDSFQRFRENAGLMNNARVKESVFLSPFRYDQNCLLYFPEYPPRQFGSKVEYYFDALAGEIGRLLDAACGHALVLFTSYSDMAAVEERLSEMNLIYPIFTMGRNPAHTMEDFKNTPDGKVQRVCDDSTKTKSSYRTLPLVEPFEKILLQMKAKQEENRQLCGNCYCQDYLEYVYVNEIGELIKPGYLTAHFPMVLKKHNMPRIRFHDLRHSCASLLFAQGVSLKEIQAWLGHSTIGTTANIYTHLDENSKINSANAILSILPK